MGIEQTIIQKLRSLPPEDHEKVAELVEQLDAALNRRIVKLN